MLKACHVCIYIDPGVRHREIIISDRLGNGSRWGFITCHRLETLSFNPANHPLYLEITWRWWSSLGWSFGKSALLYTPAWRVCERKFDWLQSMLTELGFRILSLVIVLRKAHFSSLSLSLSIGALYAANWFKLRKFRVKRNDLTS